ncbi:MAG TPA: hypothetical protein VKG45_06235 [Actinomycetes bacterium]|nr:hypothetical protein [Actinomycetes bacterium]
MPTRMTWLGAAAGLLLSLAAAVALALAAIGWRQERGDGPAAER